MTEDRLDAKPAHQRVGVARESSAAAHDRAAATEDRVAAFYERRNEPDRATAHREAAARHQAGAAADRT